MAAPRQEPETRALRQIEGEMNQLQQKLEILHDTIATLEDRLAPVLSNSGPSDVCKDVPRELLAPLAGQLRDFSDKAHIINERALGVLRRLELP